LVPPIQSSPCPQITKSSNTQQTCIEINDGASSSLTSSKEATHPIKEHVLKALEFFIKILKYLQQFFYLSEKEESTIKPSTDSAKVLTPLSSTPKRIKPKHTEILSEKTSSEELQDPFYSHIFILDQSGRIDLRNKKAYQIASNLFQILGTNGFVGLSSNRDKLAQMKTDLDSRGLHPLESLSFMLDTTNAKHIAQFQETAKSRWLRKFKLWQGFLEEIVQKFKAEEDILHMIPGFCKYFNLNQRVLLELATSQEWEKLIVYALEVRRAHKAEKHFPQKFSFS